MQNLSNDTMIQVKGKKIEYLQFNRLIEHKDILQHAITLRGNDLDFGMHNDERNYSKIVNKNYIKICNEINLDSKNIIRPKQKHTDIIKRIDSLNVPIGYLDYVDGIVTDTKGIVLSLVYADCIPFFFFDPVKKVIANIHSGWKGTVQRISVKAIKKMQEEFNCNPKDIICAIGPSIRKCHFEVDIDVVQIFINEFKDIGNQDNFIARKDNKYYIDTVDINKRILKEYGLLSDNIIDSNICTVCNSDKLYSYRGVNDKFGRFSTLISLK